MPKVSEDHREARREQILRAAVECFADQGFHRTTMDDIIKRSGLSTGAIYQYFANKGALIEAIAAQRHARESALIAEFAASDDLCEGLSTLTRSLFDLLKSPAERLRRKVAIQVWTEALRSKDVLNLVRRGNAQAAPITQKLEAAKAAGRLPADVKPEAFTRVMVAIFQGFILQQAWDPDTLIDDYVAAALFLIDSTFGARSHRAVKIPPTSLALSLGAATEGNSTT